MNTVLDIHTAQYRYSGEDRYDITAKTGHFQMAPTWDIVMGVKNRRISQQQYMESYLRILLNSTDNFPHIWRDLLNKQSVTAVCFCNPYEFCHRHLWAEFVKLYGEEKGFIVNLKGERIIST